MSGTRLLSDQKISQIVSDKALQLSQEIHKSATVTLNKTDLNVVEVNPEVDIYNLESKEILLFDDGIQVKGQKGTRQPKAKPGREFESKSVHKSKTSAVITDIVILLISCTYGINAENSNKNCKNITVDKQPVLSNAMLLIGLILTVGSRC